MTDPIESKRQQLLDWFAGKSRCAVAFSAGVDSAVVAKAAFLALGNQAVAVTGVSPSLADGELDLALAVAEQIGIRHLVVQTREFERAEYVRNGPDRCFHCKDQLYSLLTTLAEQEDFDHIVSGTNHDDLGDYRPGLTAATNHQVSAPLAQCQITKAQVRQLAHHWKLPVWDKPATPCLSSRIAYGEEVTEQRLRQIDLAEQFLKQVGFSPCRVRYHGGDLARIEVPQQQSHRLADAELRDQLVAKLKSLGFRFVTWDLEGFRSGSLNQLVQIEPS